MSDMRYYIIDTREIVGNCLLFWAKEAAGYTCDIDKAGVFDEDYCKRLSRETDVPIAAEVVEKAIVRHVRADHPIIECFIAAARGRKS